MVIFASEDVGNADPRALAVAIDALQAVELVGLPEGVLPMSQAAIYLALAPKSNAALTAYAAARRLVTERGPLPVPLRLRNAPTDLMQRLGYGGGYRYPHDFEGHYVPERYLPDAVAGAELVRLSSNGLEAELSERLAALRAAARGAVTSPPGAPPAAASQASAGSSGAPPSEASRSAASPSTASSPSGAPRAAERRSATRSDPPPAPPEGASRR
jgi:hypothetical protein